MRSATAERRFRQNELACLCGGGNCDIFHNPAQHPAPMKNSRSWLCLIGAALLPLSAHSATVDVDIKLASADTLEVSFALPEHCTALAFLKDGRDGQQIRAAWQKQNDCAVADGDLLKSAGACTARFRVPATMQKISGYPGSFPAPGGMYVHSSNYALADSCGPVRYRYLAPDIVMNSAAR